MIKKSKNPVCSVVSSVLALLIILSMPVAALAASDGTIYNAVWYVDGEKFAVTENCPGEAVVIPRSPSKEGYSFVGWEPKIPEVMPEHDISFNAEFKPCRYEAVLVADGNVVKIVEYTFGQKSISLPEVPGKTGYSGYWESYSLVAGGITVNAVYDCIAEISIVNPGNVNYGDDIELFAECKDLPENSTVVWYTDGDECGTGESVVISSASKSIKVEVKLIDADGNVIVNAQGDDIADSMDINIKTGFVAKLLAFFRKLLRMLGINV